MQSCFRLPCGQPLHSAQDRFTFPCGQGVHAASRVSACRGGRGCTLPTDVSSCREGTLCSQRSGFSACCEGRACTPRRSVSTCCEGRGCTLSSGSSASLGAGAAHRAGAFHLPVRAAFALRAVSFQLAVRAGLAHHAVWFPLPMRTSHSAHRSCPTTPARCDLRPYPRRAGRLFRVLGKSESRSFSVSRDSRKTFFTFGTKKEALDRARGQAPAAMAPHRYPMIPMPEAIDMVLSRSVQLPIETVPFRDAVGKVLASDVNAPRPHPPFPASIMDGYAVRSQDCPGVLRIVGAARAGAPHDVHGATDLNQTVYITTGAPVPSWADAVVPIERIELENNEHINIDAAYKKGANVRAIGSDIKMNETLLQAGDVIGPHELGIAALAGVVTANTHRAPRLAVLSTGDELVDPFSDKKTEIEKGSIYDANRYMLLSCAEECGCVASDLGIVKDDPIALTKSIEEALDGDCDIIVCSGGVSEGDKDFLKRVLLGEFSDTFEGVIHFGRVMMKPGKPLTFAELTTKDSKRVEEIQKTKTTLVFGLPGNPVSAAVTFALCVKPAARRMAGHTDPKPRRIHATLASDITLDNERPEYHRASLEWPSGGSSGSWSYNPSDTNKSTDTNLPTATSTGRQISSRLKSMRGAEVLLELPSGPGFVRKGQVVSGLVIREPGSGGGEMQMVRIRAAVTPPVLTLNGGVLGQTVAKAAGLHVNSKDSSEWKFGKKPNTIAVVTHRFVGALSTEEQSQESDGARVATDEGNDSADVVLDATMKVVVSVNSRALESNITWKVVEVRADHGTSQTLSNTIRAAAAFSSIVVIAPSGPGGVSSQAAVVTAMDYGFPGLADRMRNGHREGFDVNDSLKNNELNQSQTDLKTLADEHAGCGIGAGQVNGCVVCSAPPRNSYNAIKNGIERMLLVPREKWEGLVL